MLKSRHLELLSLLRHQRESSHQQSLLLLLFHLGRLQLALQLLMYRQQQQEFELHQQELQLAERLAEAVEDKAAVDKAVVLDSIEVVAVDQDNTEVVAVDMDCLDHMDKAVVDNSLDIVVDMAVEDIVRSL